MCTIIISGTGGHVSVFDMRDDNNNDFVYLSMRRRYSPYILKRRTSGPMGMGWILPHWFVFKYSTVKITVIIV